MFHRGRGVDRDSEEALRLYRLSAAQGLAQAQERLGFMLETGQGVAQDRAEAIRWYRLAAAHGDAYATAALVRLGV
jgi:TPR repeat protein